MNNNFARLPRISGLSRTSLTCVMAALAPSRVTFSASTFLERKQMEQVRLYRRLAKESAELAEEMVMPEHRQAILEIAKGWVWAAELREQMLRRLPGQDVIH